MPVTINGSGPIAGITSLNTTVSDTELGYLDGVTSAIQTQLSGKGTISTNGAWTSWTPALTASTTNPTLGTGSTTVGEYLQIGKLVFATFTIAFGSSGVNAGSGDYRISLPIAANTNARNLGGTLSINDNSTNIVRIACPLFYVNSTTISLRIDSTVTGGYTVTHAVPWAWAALDGLWGTITYEAA